MTKKILHLQVPMDTSGKSTIRDSILISPEVLGRFMKLVQEKLGDDWQVISTPFIPSVFGDTVSFYNFDMNVVNKDEFLDLIKDK